jgi:hypothetical protein
MSKYPYTLEDILEKLAMNGDTFLAWRQRYVKKGAIPDEKKDTTLSRKLGSRRFYSEKYLLILKNARSKTRFKKRQSTHNNLLVMVPADFRKVVERLGFQVLFESF